MDFAFLVEETQKKVAAYESGQITQEQVLPEKLPFLEDLVELDEFIARAYSALRPLESVAWRIRSGADTPTDKFRAAIAWACEQRDLIAATLTAVMSMAESTQTERYLKFCFKRDFLWQLDRVDQFKQLEL